MNFCEFDKYATSSYCAIHNENENKNLGDITKVDETKLEPFNMICGGSPCQDFSVAGKQKGSVWTCKDCGHEYNPLTVHWSKRDKCPCCGSNNIEEDSYDGSPCIWIEWIYESNDEIFYLMLVKKHLERFFTNVDYYLSLPYIPNARMDRVKNDDEVFTLKYFCDFINWLGF